MSEQAAKLRRIAEEMRRTPGPLLLRDQLRGWAAQLEAVVSRSLSLPEYLGGHGVPDDGPDLEALASEPSPVVGEASPQPSERPIFDQFKNFHRVLCERFGYVHDERDWPRDQISLVEWIAKKVEQPSPASAIPVAQVEALASAKAKFWRQWGVDGMPRDKIRLAEAAWKDAETAITNAQPAPPAALTKEWCMKMAALEGDSSIGAGTHSKPIDAPAALTAEKPVAWIRYNNYNGQRATSIHLCDPSDDGAIAVFRQPPESKKIVAGYIDTRAFNAMLDAVKSEELLTQVISSRRTANCNIPLYAAPQPNPPEPKE